MQITGLVGLERLVLGGGSVACRSRRLPTPCRRRQRSRPDRDTCGLIDSLTTANRSSSYTSSVLRNTTATASCARVSVVCRRSVRLHRTVRPRQRRIQCWPERPPALLASSSPDCEDGSTCLHPVLNVPQDRSCHEKNRATRVYVIIRDGTGRLFTQEGSENRLILWIEGWAVLQYPFRLLGQEIVAEEIRTLHRRFKRHIFFHKVDGVVPILLCELSGR